MTPFEVNALDYGLVPNNPSAAAANAQAIAAAFAAAPRVFLPDGQQVYSQQPAIPTTAKRLRGNATLILAGTAPGNGSALISIGGTTGFVLEDVVPQVDTNQYPTIGGVIIGSDGNGNPAVGTEIRRVTASGAYGFGSVVGPNGGPKDTLLDHCAVPFYTLQGLNFPNVTKMTIRDTEVSGGQPGSQNAFGLGGSDITVWGGRALYPQVFGLGFASANKFKVIDRTPCLL